MKLIKQEISLYEVTGDLERVAYKVMVNGKPINNVVYMSNIADIDLIQYESMLTN